MSRTAQSAKADTAADTDTVSARVAAKTNKPARGRAVAPGRITFVGSGPGDPGLLTVRAEQTSAGARTVYTDPDVPQTVVDR
ncbi:SAM-dependent methyltransferase, partial [Mycobacterium kansasii]